MSYMEIDTKTLRDMRTWPIENLKRHAALCRAEAHKPMHSKGRRVWQGGAQAAEAELARRLGGDWKQG